MSKSITNVTFNWAAIIFGGTGAGILEKSVSDGVNLAFLGIGSLLIVMALACLVLREYFKKKGLIEEDQTK